MASVNQMFVTMMNEGITASKAISDPEKKALACAEMAKALAMTGLVSAGKDAAGAVVPIEEVKETLKEKPKAKQEEVPANETAPIEPAETASAEVEVVEEWTEQMQELFAAQLEEVQQLQEEYEEEVLDEVVQNFSEGVLKGVEDISPLNIDGFLAYFKMLLEDAAE